MKTTIRANGGIWKGGWGSINCPDNVLDLLDYIKDEAGPISGNIVIEQPNNTMIVSSGRINQIRRGLVRSLGYPI